ncbi:unnamed protein product [marine sediment metagenome]|uniref:Uncharacterized protein n=1 Tax=marine sediment metagenome TaxID=412755 RepID=X1JFS8_9ZZZZ
MSDKQNLQEAVKALTKVLTRKYTKGYVNLDGTIAPFVLDEPYRLVLPLY